MVGKTKVMVHRAIAVLLIVFTISCEDKKGEHLTPNKVYFPNSGVIDVDMYDLGEDFSYRLGVYKSGVFDDAAFVSVRTMSSAELSEYDEIGELELIPTDFYTITDTNLEFGAEERNKYIDVTFSPDKINAAATPGKQFVLPLIIGDASTEINADKKVVLLVPKVTLPVVYFETSGLSNILIESSSPAVVEASFPMLANFDNRWDIHATVAVDQEALVAYNQENGTNWNILPAASYNLNSTVHLSQGKNSKGILNVSVNRSSLSAGIYILPLTIQSVSKFSIDAERKTVFLRVYYIPDLAAVPKLNRPEWSNFVTASSQQDEQNNQAYRALDGNLSTMWHPRYYNPVNHFPQYLTIDMRQIYAVTKVDIHRRAGNFRDTKAGEIQVSTDNITWTTVTTYRYPDPDTNAEHTTRLSIPLPLVNARYVRVVITESLRGSPNANLTEVEIFGLE